MNQSAYRVRIEDRLTRQFLFTLAQLIYPRTSIHRFRFVSANPSHHWQVIFWFSRRNCKVRHDSECGHMRRNRFITCISGTFVQGKVRNLLETLAIAQRGVRENVQSAPRSYVLRNKSKARLQCRIPKCSIYVMLEAGIWTNPSDLRKIN